MERDSIGGVMSLAQVEYHEMMYELDWIEGHAVLRKWAERIRREAWYAENRILKRVEGGLGWETILEV
jgi:hypothetical protein